MTETDPIERAKSHARQMYPEARVSTRSHRGKPVVLAIEGFPFVVPPQPEPLFDPRWEGE